MHLPRKLAFERGEEVDELMRLVAAGGIVKGTVNQLLQDKMPIRMRGQICLLEDEAEVFETPMQIARRENFAGGVDAYEVPVPTGRRAEGGESLAECEQETVGVGHNESNEVSVFVHLFKTAGVDGRDHRYGPG